MKILFGRFKTMMEMRICDARRRNCAFRPCKRDSLLFLRINLNSISRGHAFLLPPWPLSNRAAEEVPLTSALTSSFYGAMPRISFSLYLSNLVSAPAATSPVRKLFSFYTFPSNLILWPLELLSDPSEGIPLRQISLESVDRGGYRAL